MTAIGLGTDVGLVMIAILVAIAGWRRGALVGAGSLAGLVFGFWVGHRLLPSLLAWVPTWNGSQADHRILLSAIVLLGCGLVVQSIGFAVALAIRRRLGDGIVRGADSLGGALLNVLALGLVIWLAAGFVRTTPLITANEAVADSKIITGIDRVAPVPSTRALSSMDRFLRHNGFPQVFSGQTESVPGVAAPTKHIPVAVQKASDSVVRVVASAPSCGTGSEGTGWVTTHGRIVTNAHVVAGAAKIAVQPRGVGAVHRATLIAFDPRRDVAVLHVDRLDAAPLPTRPRLGRGDPAVVAGYPGNGPYTPAPARIRQALTARGLDIYNAHITERDIYSLRAIVRPGDSGGPLFDSKGRVAGMVFARSTSDSDTGYALTMGEIRPVLNESSADRTVGSGQCLG